MKDILVNEAGDLQLNLVKQRGLITQDLCIGHADEQIAERLLLSNRGDFKQYPQLGGEAIMITGGSIDPFWPSRAKEQLLSVGLKVSRVKIDKQTITIE